MSCKTVLISGAGVAGLTLACWLKDYGFVPTLVEKNPQLRFGGYKIDIRGAAIDVVKRMGIYPHIVESRTDIQGATFVDGSGKELTKMGADLCGGRVEGDLEIMRGDLCQILLEKAGAVECLFGDSIAQIREGKDCLHVEFERHSPRAFDLVVGADGLHSRVRQLAFGDESRFLKELGLYISVFSIPNFVNLDRWEIEYFGDKKFINVYSDRRDRSAKAGFAFSSKHLQFDHRDQDAQKQMLTEAFEGVGWEVPRLLLAMKDTPDFYFDSIAQVRMPHWSKGRIALVGDAGYAASPVSGQGTSLALVGAYVLAGELASAAGDYALAFSRYEKSLGKFVQKNQKLARMTVNFMEGKEHSLLGWLHDRLMRFMPARWIHYFKGLGTKRIHKAANALQLKQYERR